MINIYAIERNPSAAALAVCDESIYHFTFDAHHLLHLARRHFLPFESFFPTIEGQKDCPWAIWTRTSKQNYEWMLEYGRVLCFEHAHRFLRTHPTEEIFSTVLCAVPRGLPDIGLTPFIVCVPEKYKSGDAIESYRRYYQQTVWKCVWTQRKKPTWWTTGE